MFIYQQLFSAETVKQSPKKCEDIHKVEDDMKPKIKSTADDFKDVKGIFYLFCE